ncbi:VOC family protein (plasmid) [Rhizobium sophoriradicis]|uniref:VOC family protein n=1 Tax=Rhizobium sophoriradicis TaxID=1535245 RepID=UPI00161176F5|nr:VOC family protein [Rhizobium leguminosarum bv. phaseoli]
MSSGLPGFRGSDHIGITVPNLDEAIAFFCDVIGCELIYRAGAFGDDEGTFMRDQLNVHPRARIRGVAFLRCWNNSNFELFEYDSPDQNNVAPRNSDIGGHHIAFYVEDIERAVEHLHHHNIRILGNPVVEPVGPDHGVTWLYFLAPWGLQLELITYPTGKDYEAETQARLWDPRFT